MTPAPWTHRARHTIARALAPFATAPWHEKAHRASPFVAIDGPRQAVWAPRDYAAFAREGFMQNAIVYRSVRMIAESVGNVPLLVYDGSTELSDHPLASLLRQPNATSTSADFLEQLVGFLLVSGNAYIEAVAIDDEIRELHALRPDRMTIIPGPDGWPEAYSYAIDGRASRITGEAAPGIRKILHIKLFHPVNDHYGMSPIEAAASAIDLHNTAAKWNKALLDNSARPSGALVYTARDGNLTSEQYDRLKRELESGFQGAIAAGRPLLLEGGLDWKSMSLTPKDMDFLEAKNAAAREIALALGIPPLLLGIPGDNTYANYQEANRALWRQTVLPLVNRIAAALSGWLCHPLSPYSRGEAQPLALTITPDLDAVDALNPEREALWSRLDTATFLTTNEKRAAAGYDHLPGNDEIKRDLRSDAIASQQVARHKFNPHHDDRGRFTFAPDGGGDILDDSTDGARDPNIEDVAEPGSHRVELQNEGVGGRHAIDEHVGKSESYLLHRIQTSRIKGLFLTVGLQSAGSFPSLEAANKLVSSTIAGNWEEIVQFIHGPASRSRAFDSFFASPTGYEAYANSGNSQPYMRDTYGTRVVIAQDPTSPRGYRIVTAFPINR